MAQEASDCARHVAVFCTASFSASVLFAKKEFLAERNDDIVVKGVEKDDEPSVDPGLQRGGGGLSAYVDK